MRRLLAGLVRWTLLGTAALLVVAALIGAAFTWQAGRREVMSAAQAAPAGGRFVRAADVDLFVQEEGPAQGPAVVFVHGTGAWSGAWRPTLRTVAAAGFRAIALDLPPFGYSGRPAAARYGKRDQGRRIAALLAALGLHDAILVGHSFGGGPTVEAALLAPGRVRAMVLVDAALAVRADGKPFRPASPAVRALLGVRPLRNALVATFLTNPKFTRRLLQLFIDDPRRATSDWVRIYQRPLAVRGTTAAIGAWLPALLSPDAPAASEDPQTYRSLRMPVALIWGGRDSITPLEQGRRIASLVPQARLVVLNGVGHIPQIEDRKRFEAALLPELERLAGRDPRQGG